MDHCEGGSLLEYWVDGPGGGVRGFSTGKRQIGRVNPSPMQFYTTTEKNYTPWAEAFPSTRLQPHISLPEIGDYTDPEIFDNKKNELLKSALVRSPI